MANDSALNSHRGNGVSLHGVAMPSLQMTANLIGAVVGVWFEFEVNYVGYCVVECDCYESLGDSNKGEFPNPTLCDQVKPTTAFCSANPNGGTTCEAFLVIEPPC